MSDLSFVATANQVLTFTPKVGKSADSATFAWGAGYWGFGVWGGFIGNLQFHLEAERVVTFSLQADFEE